MTIYLSVDDNNSYFAKSGRDKHISQNERRRMSWGGRGGIILDLGERLSATLF